MSLATKSHGEGDSRDDVSSFGSPTHRLLTIYSCHSGQGELEDALKEMLPADEVDDASDNEVDEVFQSTEDNNTNDIVVKYNAPGVVITAITSAVVNEDGEENDGKPGVSAPTTAKSSVKHKPSTASGDESKKSKSEIKKINTNKKRKHPSGGHKNKKFPNKKFKKN
jgi:hypothetical protein